MKYLYRLTNHVKIWLGPLNLENKLRLANIKLMNPAIKLHMVFDSRILHALEIADIQRVCKEHGIILMDVLQDIIPACQSEEELNLLSTYHEAIDSQHPGKNYGAASDMLRWLSPIYRLGTVSDLDCPIDLRGAPTSLPVDSPLLLNIGNIKGWIESSLAYNNDIIAVVDPIDALPFIKKVQHAIYQMCGKHKQSSSAFHAYNEYLSHNIAESFGAFPGALMRYFVGPSDVPTHEFAQGKTATQLRAAILDLTETESSYCENQYIGCLIEKLKFLKMHYSGELRDFNFKSINEMARYMLLRDATIYTSGPAIVSLALFKAINFFDSDFRPHALAHYNLDKILPSKNTFPLDTWPMELRAILANQGIGQSNDLSWIQEGQDKIAERELAIRHNSRPVQFNAFEQSIVSSLPTFSVKHETLINELSRLARTHAEQITVLKKQFSPIPPSLQLSTCSTTPEHTVCVHTKVNFVAPSAQPVSQETHYHCHAFSNGTFGQECFGEMTDTMPLPSSFFNTLCYSALNAALLAFIPELVCDLLMLSGRVSKDSAHAIKIACYLLLLFSISHTLFEFCITFHIISIMAQGSAAEKFLNEIKNAFLFNMALPDTLSAKSLAVSTAQLAAGKLGFWAEKKLIQKVCKEPKEPENRAEYEKARFLLHHFPPRHYRHA